MMKAKLALLLSCARSAVLRSNQTDPDYSVGHGALLGR